MIKKIITTALVLCMAASAFAVTGCSSDPRPVLRVYNWEDYISEPTENQDGTIEDDYIDLIGEFEEEYGVRVEYSTFGTNENMYNELQINPGSYDLVCPSDYMIMKMISEGMVEEFSDDFLAESNYAKYASPYIKDLFEQNGWTNYAVAYMWGTMGYVYNPELSDTVEEDLSSWEGLWTPEYAKVATIKDSVRDSYFLGVAVVYRDELIQLKEQFESGELDAAAYNARITEIMNRTDEDTLEKTKDKLIDLKQNLYGFEIDSGKQDMIAGRISINFAWSGDAVYTMDDAEPYIDENGREVPGIYLNYIVPEECSNIWFDGWVMPKGANVELVYEEMVDWYSEGEEGDLDEEGNPLIAYDLSYFFNGTSDGAYDDGEYIIYVSEESSKRQISAQYPTEEVLQRSAIMQHFDDDTNAAVNEMWEEVKGLPIPAWAYIVIAVIAGMIVIAVLSYLYKGKRREPKAKKGYKILKKSI